MLTKNCRAVIDTILSLDKSNPFKLYRIADLAIRARLTIEEAMAACLELEQDGRAEVRLIPNARRQIPEYVSLTEYGARYREELKERRKDYIKAKWIDFFALIVAIIALIISIAAFLRPLPG